MKGYCVYKHTAPNGKVYIGITSRKPTTRWQNGKGYHHNEYFYRAIMKYGWNNFSHEIVAENLCQADAECMEKDLILKYESTNPEKGFNILCGGDARQGLNGSLNGMYDVHLCGELNGMFGKKHSEETRQKISESKKGRTLSEERKSELSKMFSGSKNPMYGVHRYGDKNPFYGKTHTEETRSKISKARMGKYKGSENPNSRSVICLTTGEVFDSLSSAVAKYKLGQGNLSMACKNPNRSCGKLPDGTRLKWSYFSES